MQDETKLQALSATVLNTSKPLWRSKTFWLQVLALAAVFFPGVREWIASNPVEPVVALAALNILVRFATSDRVTVFPEDKDSGELVPDGTRGSSGGELPALLLPLCMTVTALGCGLLSSCAAAPSFPVRIGLVTELGRATWSSSAGLQVDAVIRPEK